MEHIPNDPDTSSGPLIPQNVNQAPVLAFDQVPVQDLGPALEPRNGVPNDELIPEEPLHVEDPLPLQQYDGSEDYHDLLVASPQPQQMQGPLEPLPQADTAPHVAPVAAPPAPAPQALQPPMPASEEKRQIKRPSPSRPARRAASRPSTSANPPDSDEEDEQHEHDRSLSPTMFTNGIDPVNISPKHLKNHPLHTPTGTSEALSFYPTMEEFKNFNRYIQKIEAVAAHLKSGIAKIVPPEGWSPRPNMKDFSDADNYVISDPSTETMKQTTKLGVYEKTNTVHIRNLKVKDFRTMAMSPKYRNPKPHLEGRELEKYYFDNILKGEPIYGADTEGSFYEKGVKEWNMKDLGTILNELEYEIKGVNTVYLYFGMYKTTFPWHAEDMDLYSINYLHFGAPKYWFAISSDYADRFERFMCQQFSYAEESTPTCKAFLRHKTSVITPELIKAAGIPYSTMTQRANEFIITFPRGYHMGFNTGYNLAESTNFAAPRWIDYGKDVVLCTCMKSAVRIEMRDYLKKYRPNLHEVWDTYWYGEQRFYWYPLLKKDLPRKRKADIQYEAAAKRRKLGNAGRNDRPSSSGGSGSDAERVPFYKRLEGYDTTVCKMKPDYDEMMRVFKRETKLFRSSSRIDFYHEMKYNELQAREWPHCAVCSYFQPTHMCASRKVIPEASRRLIPTHCFAKNGVKDDQAKEDIDRLLRCKNCRVTVHSKCCTGDQPAPGEEWLCLRCKGHTDDQYRQITCELCELRGGAFIRCQIGTNNTWAHVICALFNRRTSFDRAEGPTKCFVEPEKHQVSETKNMPPLSKEYKEEFGDLYETLRLECIACKEIKNGLIPCVLCIEEAPMETPVQAHITCARRVGFSFEVRDHPRDVVMVCHRHQQTYLQSRQPTCTNVKANDNVFVEDETADGQKRFINGVIARQMKKETAVVDFYDNSCSRDISSEDIQSCECLYCENGNHQYGARLKILWDDKQIYDAYYRGKGSMTEYMINLEDGRSVKHPRNKIKTKREYNAYLRASH